MEKNSKKPDIETPEVDATEIDDVVAETAEGEVEDIVSGEGVSEVEALKDSLQQREDELAASKKEYLFLMAEFDNFRKRTLREKSEIIKNGAENALRGLLPVLDDFERGLAAINDSSDATSVKEGMTLIYNKFVKYLEQNGVKEIEANGTEFNPDFHEAIAMVPVEDAVLKGKVIDTVTKGYMLNDKVIRHAKVAVGQ